MPHSSSIVIVHGGTWTGKDYSGGDEQLMLIPPVDPIKFTDLLSKIEQRLMKPKSRYVYEIYALVRSPSSQTIKMKIMDDVDVDHVLNELEKPILYITTTPINDELLEIVNHQASQGTKAKVTNLPTKASLNKFGGRNLETRELDRGFGRGLDQELLDRDLDRGVDLDLLDRDLDRGLDRDLDRGLDRDFDRGLDRGLDRDLDRGLDRDLDRRLDRDLDREEDDHHPSVTIRLDDDEEEDDRDSLDDMDCGSIRQTWVSQGSSNHVFEGDHQYTGQWIIPAASYHLKEPTSQENVDYECIYDDTLRKDAIFASKDRLITVLGLYHLANHVSFSTPRSCFTRYYVVCKNRKAKCSFVLLAQAIGTAWRIHEWSPHSCQKDLRYQSEPTICSKVLGAYFVPNLMTAGVVLRPMDIIAQVERKFGAKIKYQTALAARNHALTMVYGDAMKSFERLPKYLWILEHANSGTVTELKLDADGKFRYCFMALVACIRGFKACRPVIVVDGTHLKGKYKGVMFVVVTKDPNEQILPLAFGFGDKECDESWAWFFTQLRNAFGCPENLLIVSDQHVSIKNALDVVYPGIPHGLCVYHIQNNIKFWGDSAIAVFQQAVHAYRERDFDTAMNNLKSFAPGAYSKVMGIDPIKWARSKCPVRRYCFLTSNAAECVNGCLRWARALPVCTLFECIRSLIGKWFLDRRAEAAARTHELTGYAQSRLSRSLELGSTMSVEPVSLTKFKVSTGMKHHVVDLEKKQCTCLIFNLDLIPCSHAAAAIRHTKQSPLPFVSSYYSTESLRETYAGEVMPIPIPEEWNVPTDIEEWSVGAPDNPKQANRLRKRRMKAKSGSSRSQSNGNSNSYTPRCSRCSQTGHYQNTCSVSLPNPTEVSSLCANGNKQRKQKKCSICGVLGHTHLTCKDIAPPP